MEGGNFRSTLILIATICIVLGVAALVIAYGRGYRMDITQKSVSAPGLLVATSEPTGAQLLVNGKVTSATNATINLKPDWYTITIVKEGYQPWEKKLRVQGEVVTRADAFLFPTNPSLTALTASGVASPTLSPDGTKLAFVVPNIPGTANGVVTRTGIWVLDLVDKPLSLNRDARVLAKSGTADWSRATLRWSPDSKQVLACLGTTPCYLLDADKTTETPVLAATSALSAEWKDQEAIREKEKRAVLKEDFVTVATSAAKLISFSPDETKLLYQATRSATIPQVIKPALFGTNTTPEPRDIIPGNLYVYDIKEDRNYILGDAKSFGSIPIQWLPTSRHLLVVGKDKIEVLEFDASNRKTVYAGPFWDGFAVPWASGNKIIIATNLNSGATSINNLYAINLH